MVRALVASVGIVSLPTGGACTGLCIACVTTETYAWHLDWLGQLGEFGRESNNGL